MYFSDSHSAGKRCDLFSTFKVLQLSKYTARSLGVTKIHKHKHKHKHKQIPTDILHVFIKIVHL